MGPFTRAAGATAAGGRAPLERRDLFLWGATILLFNRIFYAVQESAAFSPYQLATDLAAIGIFQYLAWYVVFRRLRASDRARAAEGRDFLAIIALGLLVFVPTARMIWVAASGFALYLWMVGAGDRGLRGAAIVLAALSVQEFWGHVVFDLVAFPLLHVETALVGSLLKAAGTGAVWQDNVITEPSGHGIVLYPYCSSFHNLSLAVLCWIAVCNLDPARRPRPGRDFAVGCAIAAVMISLNVMRLCLMALNAGLYDYWHRGAGAEIFAIGASLTVLLLSLYASGEAAPSR